MFEFLGNLLGQNRQNFNGYMSPYEQQRAIMLAQSGSLFRCNQYGQFLNQTWIPKKKKPDLFTQWIKYRNEVAWKILDRPLLVIDTNEIEEGIIIEEEGNNESI